MSKKRSIAEHVLEKYSAKEISSGKTVPQIKRFKTETGDRLTYVDKKIKGLNIPASTIHRMQLPESDPKHLKPSPKTIHKLNLFFQRTTYNSARAVGVPVSEARRTRFKAPGEARKDLEYFRTQVKRVAKNKKLPLIYVAYGFSLSDKTQSEFEQYFSQKNYSKPSKADLRESAQEIALFYN